MTKVMNRRKGSWGIGALAAAMLMGGGPAAAWEINVGFYGFAPTAMPYAVALKEGFYKEAGVDITAIRNAAGGNAARLLLAGPDILYVDGGLPAAIAAVQSGAGIKIVADTAHNVGGVSWVVMPNSPLKTPADIKGKRIAFGASQSIIEAWTRYLVQHEGLTDKDVTLVAPGDIRGNLTLLETGGVDVAAVDLTTLFANPDKYRVLVAGTDSAIFPAVNTSIGFTTTQIAQDHPDLIKAVIAAHRKAIEFMSTNRDQAARDIAEEFKADPAVIRRILDQTIDHGGVNGTEFFGKGNFDYAAIATTVEMSQGVGSIAGTTDIKSMIDESFLPDDLKSK